MWDSGCGPWMIRSFNKKTMDLEVLGSRKPRWMGMRSSQTSAQGEIPGRQGQASSWFLPPVTATPCGSAHWFQWGCCYRGWGPVPTEEER